MAITNQIRTPATFGEVIVQHWQVATTLETLRHRSVLFTTLDKCLGRLHKTDLAAPKPDVQIILG
jgi:hypothetical protein